MRTRAFRIAALTLGILGIPSLIVQVWRDWPPTDWGWAFYGIQAAVLFAFLAFGLGLPRQEDLKNRTAGEDR